MSRMQRDKGADFEREVVNRIKDFGFHAKRNLTQVRDGGHDIDTDCLGKIECKRRRKLAAYLTPQPGVAMVVARSDRGRRMVILDLDDFLATAQMAHAARRATDAPPGIRERGREAQDRRITASEIVARLEARRRQGPAAADDGQAAQDPTDAVPGGERRPRRRPAASCREGKGKS